MVAAVSLGYAKLPLAKRQLVAPLHPGHTQLPLAKCQLLAALRPGHPQLRLARHQLYPGLSEGHAKFSLAKRQLVAALSLWHSPLLPMKRRQVALVPMLLTLVGLGLAGVAGEVVPHRPGMDTRGVLQRWGKVGDAVLPHCQRWRPPRGQMLQPLFAAWPHLWPLRMATCPGDGKQS